MGSRSEPGELSKTRTNSEKRSTGRIVREGEAMKTGRISVSLGLGSLGNLEIMHRQE